jgi:hypothetical protein
MALASREKQQPIRASSKDRIGGPIRFSLPPDPNPRDRAAPALNRTAAFVQSSNTGRVDLLRIPKDTVGN